MSQPLSELFRTAFVTGAGTGLGRAFTEMLLADGVRVWGTSRDPSRLAPLATASDDRFTPVALELADGAAAEATLLAADQAAGRFDLVINNAGYGVFAEFATADFAVWQRQLEVMLINTARLSHTAIRRFRDPVRAGRLATLVNISSLAAQFPLPFQSAYNMCKAGLSALNESLIDELKGTGIVVIDFRPGDYRTDFEGSVQRPQRTTTPAMQRAWAAFERMMASGPEPAGAAGDLRRALLRQRSGTVRTGRFFQATVAPFIARLGSSGLQRRIRARYFDLP